MDDAFTATGRRRYLDGVRPGLVPGGHLVTPGHRDRRPDGRLPHRLHHADSTGAAGDGRRVRAWPTTATRL